MTSTTSSKSTSGKYRPDLAGSTTATPKALIVTRTFLPEAGGIEDYVYSRCLRSPDSIAVLSASCPHDRAFDAQQTFPVHRWPVPPLPKIKVATGLLKQIIYLFWELIDTLRLYSRYRYETIEWCHGYDFPVLLLLSYLLPIRCTMYLHGNDLLCPLRNPLIKPLFALTLNRMDKIVCNSHFTKGYLEQNFRVRSSIQVINPTVRPDKFGSPPTAKDIVKIRQHHCIPEQAIVLLSVGRLVPRKGFDTVIKLLPRLLKANLDVHYLVCGKGKQQAALQSLSDQLGLTNRVHFAGYVPDDQLASHYAACDIFALPTFFNAADQSVEGFGIVYAEAGYFGKPVVACDVGGVGDVVKHNENGLMVAPDQPDEIFSAIVRLCQNLDLRHRLGHKGRELALQNLPAIRPTVETLLDHKPTAHPADI